MREAAYQTKLIKRLEAMFPGCHIQRGDPSELQGIPDLLILFGGRWAMLEVKTSADAKDQPNQPYYVEKFNNMSFAAVIHPQNEEGVLYDLAQVLDGQRV